MKRYSQSIFDILQRYPGFIMLIQKDPVLPIDDKSADTLYNIWKHSTNNQLEINSENENMTKLLETGYIRKSGDIVEITDKGKNLVLEMGLGRPNSFSTEPEPSYSDIKKRASQRNRKRVTFTKKASKEIEPFNLKKARSNVTVNKKQTGRKRP